MNLESQICALEYAKQLKELGVVQNSFLYWADEMLVSSIDLDLLLDNGKVRNISCVDNSWPDQDIGNLYSAFTSTELGEMLPDFFDSGKKDNIWMCRALAPISSYVEGDTEANCRAKMLIYLIENELCKI